MTEITDPKPPLLYGFVDPQVYLTITPDDPVRNTLSFHITNYEKDRVVAFENPDGITPDDPLPPIDDDDPGYILDRFYLYFFWGSEPGDLCTKEEAEGIVCSPGPENDSWDCVPMRSQKLGRYWILFTKKKAVLDGGESVRFLLENIVTTAKAGTAPMRIKHEITGYEVGTDGVAVHKKDPDPVIIPPFTANPLHIGQDCETTVYWQTRGATQCKINDEPVVLNGSLQRTLHETTRFSLVASRPDHPSASAQITVEVKPPEILEFNASPDQPIERGESVTLRWRTRYSCNRRIEPGVGEVEAGGSIGVSPDRTTVYRLICEGLDGPIEQSVTVEVRNVEIKSFKADRTTIKYGEDTILRWEVLWADSARITHVAEPITLPQGQVTVAPKETTTYTLICEGPNGPVQEAVTVKVDKVRIDKFYSNCVEDPFNFWFWECTIHWKTIDADTCELIHVKQNRVISRALEGSYETGMNITQPSENYHYRLKCQGLGGTVEKDLYLGAS